MDTKENSDSIQVASRNTPEATKGTEATFKVSGEELPQSAWARYILDLAHGYSKITAIQRSGITGTELAEARRDPQCAQLELASLRVAATGDLSAITRILAQSAGPNMILDAIEESRDRDGVSARDRLGNRRTVLEAARILGSSAQQPSVTINASQAAVLIQQMQGPVPRPD